MNDIIQVIHNCIALTKQIVDNTVRSGANVPGMITACQKLETLLFDKYIYSSKNKDDIIMFNIILSTASKAATKDSSKLLKKVGIGGAAVLGTAGLAYAGKKLYDKKKKDKK